MGKPTFDTWKIIPVGMICLRSRMSGPLALSSARAAKSGRRAVALAVLCTVPFSHDSLSWDKSSKLAELRKADRPSPLMRRARAGQAIFDGRYGRERNKTVEVVFENNRNGFQVSIKGILT